jgi:catechol 2,3-dioxygenase-like lactoylglutathione lyase family enzyme
MRSHERRDETVLDHVGIGVADYRRSKAFYEKALAPLGYSLLMEFSGAAAGFGKEGGGRPSFFIEAHGEPARGRLHIAFGAESRDLVDAFHAAALGRAEPTTARPAFAGTTTTTTAATSSIPTATTSRPSATNPARTRGALPPLRIELFGEDARTRRAPRSHRRTCDP